MLALLFNGSLALSQDVYFESASLYPFLKATWKPDGAQFATFGVAAGRPDQAVVEIWRDNDGLRLLTLDHFLLMVEPGQYFLDPNAIISDVYWSDDGETIATIAYTYNH